MMSGVVDQHHPTPGQNSSPSSHHHPPLAHSLYLKKKIKLEGKIKMVRDEHPRILDVDGNTKFVWLEKICLFSENFD